MRLSCNFVNVYTITYCVQCTFTRVHARILNGHPREENRACRTTRRTSRRGSSCVSGSDKRAALRQLTASYSCGKLWLNGRHADILATILAKMSVSVSLSVSVPWNSSFTEAGPLVKLNNYKYDNLFFLHCYALFLSTYSVTFRKSFFQICFHLSPVSYRHLLPTASKTS